MNQDKSISAGADLAGADLVGADLRRANLRRANLTKADLAGADLAGADLTGADLWRANFNDITCNWQSHDLIAALLRSEAGDCVAYRSLAGLVLMSRDWCWSQFWKKVAPSDRDWALKVLTAYTKPGDDAPIFLPRGGRV